MHNQLTTLTAPLTFTLVHPEPLHQLQSISSASEDQWMIALVRILPCRSMTWSQTRLNFVGRSFHRQNPQQLCCRFVVFVPLFTD